MTEFNILDKVADDGMKYIDDTLRKLAIKCDNKQVRDIILARKWIVPPEDVVDYFNIGLEEGIWR